MRRTFQLSKDIKELFTSNQTAIELLNRRYYTRAGSVATLFESYIEEKINETSKKSSRQGTALGEASQAYQEILSTGKITGLTTSL